MGQNYDEVLSFKVIVKVKLINVAMCFLSLIYNN